MCGESTVQPFFGNDILGVSRKTDAVQRFCVGFVLVLPVFSMPRFSGLFAR